VEIGEMQAAQLGHPKPCRVQGLDDEAVSKVRARVHQGADLVSGERRRCPLDTTATHDPSIDHRPPGAFAAVQPRGRN